MKIKVQSLPDYGRRIPVNGEIKNTKFEMMLLDAQKGFAILTKEPSNLPSQFTQEDIKRVEPDWTEMEDNHLDYEEQDREDQVSDWATE